jgi:DNA-binding LacI/PurR family transcriptional regulator
LKQATIQDVAERAGVSRATVSRVLNDNPNVDDDLRVRVREAMQSLAYRPNRAARRLRGSFNDVIGLIIPDIQNPVFVTVARGVEDAAYQRKINVLLCNADDNLDKQQDYLRHMRLSGFPASLSRPRAAATAPFCASTTRAGCRWS